MDTTMQAYTLYENVIMHASHHGSTCIHALVNGIHSFEHQSTCLLRNKHNA